MSATASSASSSSSSSSTSSTAPFFEILSHPPTSIPTSGPRVGRLLGRLDTPHLLTYTQYGLPPHLTIDNWEHLPDLTAFHISLATFLSAPSASDLTTYYSPPTLGGYLAYPASSVLLLSLLDPLLPASGPSNDASYTVLTPQGNQRVSPLTFIRRALTLRPELLLLMSDAMDAGQEGKQGREKKAVQRSAQWLRQQLEMLYAAESKDAATEQHDAEDSEPRKSKRQRRMERQQKSRDEKAATVEHTEEESKDNGGSSTSQHPPPSSLPAPSPSFQAEAHHRPPPYLVASIPHCSDAASNAHFMQQLLSYQHLLHGYSIPCSAAAAAYPTPAAIIAQLPPSALRVSSSHPPRLSSLLSVISSGVDLISTTLPTHHSLASLALSLRSPTLNVSSASLSVSTEPLCSSCRCFTCRNHTRGYLRHLLTVGEMTGVVLLELHNWAIVGQLMEEARSAMQENAGQGWEEWRDAMQARLQDNEKTRAAGAGEREGSSRGRAEAQTATASDGNSSSRHAIVTRD